MTLPHVTICAPIRDRGWVIPRYLKHIDEMAYPKNRISLLWVVHDCTDATHDLLMDFGKGYLSREVATLNLGKSPRYYGDGALRLATERAEVFDVLAYLRNWLFQRKPATADYMLSIDSDVLVTHNTLNDLLLLADNNTIVSGIIKNAPNPGIYNFLMYDKQTDTYTRKNACRSIPDVPFTVGLAGAVTLYPRQACELGRFSVCKTGEDEGLARSLVGHNIKYIMQPKVKCTHVMSPTCELRW